MTSNKYKNHWQQHQAQLWGLKPPHHTHLGNRFFKFEHINLIQDSFSLLLSFRNVTLRSPNTCRNVTLRSNITVSERDTLIQYYRVETWHSDPILPCRKVTLRSIYLIILFYQVFFMSRRHLNREDLRLKIQQSHHSDHHNYTITTYKHTIKHIEDFTIPPNTYQSLFRVYLSHRNKP